MTRIDDDATGRSTPSADGDPPRDVLLRRMLEQLPQDVAPPNPEFVARAQREWQSALHARRRTPPPIGVRRFGQITLPLALAASMAASVYSLLRPLPEAVRPDDPLLAASIGTLTRNSQLLWSSNEPFGFNAFRSPQGSNDE